MKTTMFVNGRKYQVINSVIGFIVLNLDLPFAVKVDVKNNKLVPVVGSNS